jgi:GNAT superfamily N-acetyltransferase
MIDSAKIQSALHARTELAFAAARSSQLPGTFESWQTSGMFSTCVSDPELQFLSNVVVTGSPAVDDLEDALAVERWRGTAPGVVLWDEPPPAVDAMLRNAGYTVDGWRPVAVRMLARENGNGHASGVGRVQPVADDALDEFSAVLLSTYEVGGVVARFIESEHRSAPVQRFAVLGDSRMIAVAGMTLHEAGAVPGGAATLPAERGRGAQGLLLRHRLHQALQAGCDWAVATAAPGSPSVRNLERLGFTVRNRWSFRMSK